MIGRSPQGFKKARSCATSLLYLAWSCRNFCYAWLCDGDNCLKKPKYSEYWSFQHFLFSCVYVCVCMCMCVCVCMHVRTRIVCVCMCVCAWAGLCMHAHICFSFFNLWIQHTWTCICVLFIVHLIMCSVFGTEEEVVLHNHDIWLRNFQALYSNYLGRTAAVVCVELEDN